MRKQGVFLNVFSAGLVVAFSIAIISRHPATGPVPWFSLNLLLALVFLRLAATVAHEIGHALSAKAVGLKVFDVVLGTGRPLLSFMTGSTRVTICRLPKFGYTRFAAPPGLKHAVSRMLVAITAGPLTNLGVFLVIGLASDVPGWGIDSPRWTTQLAPIEALQWANLFAVIFTLVPARISTPTGITPTDGHHVLEGLRSPRKMAQRLEESYYAITAHDFVRSGDIQRAREIYQEGLSKHPRSFLLKHCLAVASIAKGDFADSREQLLKLLGSKEEQEHFAGPYTRNAIAYADAMLGDHNMLEEADRFSREALADAPKTAAFQGTRGAVLVQMDQVQQGIELLLRAYNQHTEPVARAGTAVWIGIACARSGDVVEGQRWLARATQQCKECPETLLAARELDGVARRDQRRSLQRGVKV